MSFKLIKSSIFIILIQIYNVLQVQGLDASSIDPESAGAISIIDSSGQGFSLLDDIFAKINEYIFALMALILIGVFIYVGYLFITSDGDEAQFKKAWKTFVYSIIGIIIIILSWGAVKLISSIGI